MNVSELIEILQQCPPDARVKIPGEGYQTSAGTWLEGDSKDIEYVLPAEEFRADAKTVYLEA